MKKMISMVMVAAVMVVTTGVFAQSVRAEEVRMVGRILKIEMGTDGGSAKTIVKDTMSGESVTVIVSDEPTLEKFIEKLIVEGDEIGCKYLTIDGTNHSRMFKIKTTSC